MIRRFHLERKEDVHGVSGTGRVAEGVEFTNGVVAMSWRHTDFPSTTIFPNIHCVEGIHGHEGRTVVVWEDK